MTAERPARDRHIVAVSAVLFVVAFALRFAVASYLAGEPVWDGHYYDFGARRIAEGHGYSDDRIVGGVATWHPWCHYPVGYSAFLAAFYRAFGATVGVANAANAMVGGALAVMVYLLAREGLSPWRSRFAGALVAVHPGLVLYGALVMSEPLSALVVTTAFWVALRVQRLPLTYTTGDGVLSSWGSTVQGAAAGALVLGLGALVRPQALLCAPFLALASGAAGWPRRAAAAVVACAVTVVPILPWTARNCRVMDGCALVSTNAGWNLAIGAFPRATGRFEGLHSSDGCREVTGQVQQDRCWLAYGIAHIRKDPTRWLGLVPKKLAFTFDHESFAVEYLHEARPEQWPEERRAAWRSILSGTHRVLALVAPLAFVALALGRRRAAVVQLALLGGLLGFAALMLTSDTPSVWPVVVATCVLAWLPLPGRPPGSVPLQMSVGLIATTVLAHAVFFGEDRYHVAITPALCLLAAAALRRPDAHDAGVAGARQSMRGAITEVGAPREKAQAK